MWTGIVVVIALIVGALLWFTAMPGQAPLNTVASNVDSEDGALIHELESHVQYLAGTIGERNFRHLEQLDLAAAYIEQRMQVTGATVKRETYTLNGEQFLNLVAELPGNRMNDEIVVVGAHYDSVIGSPGANDNASGVAALLALLDRLADRPLARTVRFIAFTNEEPPFFRSKQMGSAIHAESARARGQKIQVMLALETIGYFDDRHATQRYPFPLSWFYPDRGNFIAFVGDLRSRAWVRRAVRLFREQVLFPAEGIAAPAIFPGLDWSDHWSFWRAGYAGLMVTDTAPYRYREYHSAEDRPGNINYPRMAKVVEGLTELIADFASE